MEGAVGRQAHDESGARAGSPMWSSVRSFSSGPAKGELTPEAGHVKSRIETVSPNTCSLESSASSRVNMMLRSLLCRYSSEEPRAVKEVVSVRSSGKRRVP